jgi:hypothetical protein
VSASQPRVPPFSSKQPAIRAIFAGTLHSERRILSVYPTTYAFLQQQEQPAMILAASSARMLHIYTCACFMQPLCHDDTPTHPPSPHSLRPFFGWFVNYPCQRLLYAGSTQHPSRVCRLSAASSSQPHWQHSAASAVRTPAHLQHGQQQRWRLSPGALQRSMPRGCVRSCGGCVSCGWCLTGSLCRGECCCRNCGCCCCCCCCCC